MKRIVWGMIDQVVFTTEIVMRIIAHGSNFFYMPGCAWNLFDSVLVALQLIEEFTSIIVSGCQFW